MRNITLIFTLVLLAFSSCKTAEKVIYFQDLAQEGTIASRSVEEMRFKPEDKLTVVVTSGRTPQLALQFNLSVQSTSVTTGTSYSANQIGYYTVSADGYIDMPVLGLVKAAGLTRSELSTSVQQKIREQNLINDAVVTVNSLERYITVLGEVKSPGRVLIQKDHMTILEAIGAVGDLGIQARRDRILVMRHEGNEIKNYYVDLRDSKSVLNSPVYYLAQDDVIYVEPNEVRTGQSTVNDNSIRSISTWLALTSTIVSIAILIFRK